jgi:hypothetical protein
MRHRFSSVDCLWQWLQLARPAPCSPNPLLLSTALSLLDARCSKPVEDQEKPVFVFATSWRSGSTLLQRILATDDSLLLWGEPLGRMGLLQLISSSLCAISSQWPPAGHWCPPQLEGLDLTSEWTANFYPEVDDFRIALRQFVLRWLGESAAAHGRPRWGLKEVRLGRAEAQLLSWLFPQAKFLVLLRHPFDTYRSVSRIFPPGQSWNMYSRWPDVPMEGAVPFARHWNSLTTSWLLPGTAPAHMKLRYEDLISGQFDIGKLEQFLELRLAPQRATKHKSGATPDYSPLKPWEKLLIQHVAAEGMRASGYLTDGTCLEMPLA